MTLFHIRVPNCWLTIALATLILSVNACNPPAAKAADKPNIIYIMSDDMGYSDIGCYGSEIKTPNLNSLADDGIRFTQFYNTGRCCPTRASLLTGLYPHQAGIGHMVNDRGHDGYRGELNRQSVTIPEVLQSAGYRSYLSGKWHVTQAVNPKTESDKHNWPLQRGFDRFYGTIHGAGSFFDPNTLSRDNTFISPFADPEYQPKQMANGEYYYTDRLPTTLYVSSVSITSSQMTSHFSCMSVSLLLTGLCMPSTKTSKSTKESMTLVTTQFETPAMSECLNWV